MDVRWVMERREPGREDDRESDGLIVSEIMENRSSSLEEKSGDYNTTHAN